MPKECVNVRVNREPLKSVRVANVPSAFSIQVMKTSTLARNESRLAELNPILVTGTEVAVGEPANLRCYLRSGAVSITLTTLWLAQVVSFGSALWQKDGIDLHILSPIRP